MGLKSQALCSVYIHLLSVFSQHDSNIVISTQCSNEGKVAVFMFSFKFIVDLKRGEAVNTISFLCFMFALSARSSIYH